MAAPVAFVAGATGFVGRAVVPALRRAGVTTIAHVRPDSARLDEWRKRFASTGLWERDEGLLLIRNRDGRLVGHIEFFVPVSYLDGYELSYQLYDDAHAGHGYTTEAVQLLVDYLFGTKKKHRIQLVIVPDNAASERIAAKCGFTYEGRMRGAFFNDGRNHDVDVFSLLRDDPRPWRGSGT